MKGNRLCRGAATCEAGSMTESARHAVQMGHRSILARALSPPPTRPCSVARLPRPTRIRSRHTNRLVYRLVRRAPPPPRAPARAIGPCFALSGVSRWMTRAVYHTSSSSSPSGFSTLPE